MWCWWFQRFFGQCIRKELVFVQYLNIFGVYSFYLKCWSKSLCSDQVCELSLMKKKPYHFILSLCVSLGCFRICWQKCANKLEITLFSYFTLDSSKKTVDFFSFKLIKVYHWKTISITIYMQNGISASKSGFIWNQ